MMRHDASKFRGATGMGRDGKERATAGATFGRKAPTEQEDSEDPLFAGNFGERAIAQWTLVAAGSDVAAHRALIGEVAKLRADEKYDGASAIERILIDAMVVAWLKSAYSEAQEAGAQGRGKGLMRFWRDISERCQKSLIAASKALACFRRATLAKRAVRGGKSRQLPQSNRRRS